ncbi:ATPase, T2SS/T4P/T4SS family [Candidatus Methylospira mobilis]|uniref:type IV pilus twitching motility protein PilT n=1 Tax=Candidatus Methylospira mobilis TaxID=1808979 RepID=UPI0028EB31F4|nr:ATPase, T2SS/T4P/T4SS family [Candidatus Methylospira mobilis]WNV05859.1 ATPase, T2SS/T4P/T4SS family [Candidatus Methylospira mobilis]
MDDAAMTLYPEENLGVPWDIERFDGFLKWATTQKASDVALEPNKGIWTRVHGTWRPASHRKITSHEIGLLLDATTTKNGTAIARTDAGYDIDGAYQVKVDRFRYARFRVNGTACRDGSSSSGISIIYRTIPSVPLHIDELSLEPAITENIFPHNGLILATGVMGSGKSTLLASVLRFIAENHARHIMTYESPIEFDLTSDEIKHTGPCTQIQIPDHLHDFVSAPRNSARRAADVVMYGESRDQETLRSMIEEAEIGVAVYSTVHTRSVAETLPRIINVFPSALQNQVASSLISSIRLIVHQRLLPKTGGGRVAVREFLSFDANLRSRLIKVPLQDIGQTVQSIVEEQGQPLIEAAERAFRGGEIAEVDKDVIFKEFSQAR